MTVREGWTRLDDCGLAVGTAQGSAGVRVDGVVEDGFGVGFGDGVLSLEPRSFERIFG